MEKQARRSAILWPSALRSRIEEDISNPIMSSFILTATTYGSIIPSCERRTGVPCTAATKRVDARRDRWMWWERGQTRCGDGWTVPAIRGTPGRWW